MILGNLSSSKIRVHSGSFPQHSEQERKRERKHANKIRPPNFGWKGYSHYHKSNLLKTWYSIHRKSKWPWQLEITYEFQFSFDKRQSWSSRLNPIFFSFSEKALKWKRQLVQPGKKIILLILNPKKVLKKSLKKVKAPACTTRNEKILIESCHHCKGWVCKGWV